MSFCSNCGTELTEGTAFCPNCGAGQVRTFGVQEQPVSAPTPEVVPAGPVYQEPAPVYQPVYQQPMYQPQIEATPTLTGAAKILSLISMICGLVSLASGLGGFALGIAAIILSNISSNKAPGVPNKKARVGKITGIFGIIISVLVWVVYICYFFLLGVELGMETGAYYNY